MVRLVKKKEAVRDREMTVEDRLFWPLIFN